MVCSQETLPLSHHIITSGTHRLSEPQEFEKRAPHAASPNVGLWVLPCLGLCVPFTLYMHYLYGM